jgi:drug/metabolite transporter (DMT)-like permease
LTQSKFRLYASFASVYVLWGSTYVAIRYAIETLPPFLMAGARFLISGSILYAWARLNGTPAPARREWRTAAIVGALLLLVGNGGVVLSEQRIPSSLAALLVSGTPMWMTVIDWIFGSGPRPRGTTVVGLVLGMAGVAILVSPADFGSMPSVDPRGAALVLVASMSWASGSIYSRHAPLPASPTLTTGMEMLAGGTLLLSVGLLTGEPAKLIASTVTLRSVLAVVYLIGAGSLLGYTSYVYLLKNTTPARATTYAYVNPAVAVLLGWALAGEPITFRMLGAGSIIIVALIMITRSKAA